MSAAEMAAEARPLEAVTESRYAFHRGGDFILNQPETPPALWGEGSDILLAEGESLVIAGAQGLGKTTLAQQLALGRCGFPEYAELLGYAIAAGYRRCLYLAMDRPRQAARSFRRMVGDAWRDELDDRLTIWPGPPPFDLAKHPGVLKQLALDADADTVIVDSLKDAAIGLTDDEVGAGWNRARQTALAAGIQLIEIHHNRKAPNGSNKAHHPTLDDLYGSVWIGAGAGSVLMLTGKPGDLIVGAHHVKPPANQVGPLKITHDHDAGRSRIMHGVDLVQLAACSFLGLTAKAAAQALFDTDTPDRNEVEKARRDLERLTTNGRLTRRDGDKTTSTATAYFATTQEAS